MSRINYGPVTVLAGPHQGRIAYFDNDEDGQAVCYFGSILMHEYYAYIDYCDIGAVTTADLFRRKNEIMRAIFPFQDQTLDGEEKTDLLYELLLIDGSLIERIEAAKLSSPGDHRQQIFISHSSRDAHIAWQLSVDLGNSGFRPWLDEWEIDVGESIPAAINQGIGDCEALIVLLSPAAVESGWVEREWQAKYWDEAQAKSVKVLPALIESCEVPPLLRPKKYADFRDSYDHGLTSLIKALNRRRNA